MKCCNRKCCINYGKREVRTPQKYCEQCEKPLVLREFWSFGEIEKDLVSGLSQKNPIALVADNGKGLTGFTWGYQLPLEKFPCLAGKVQKEVSYMDEIAVRGNRREKGIGTALGLRYLETAKQQGMLEVVLRTDERNKASMALFRKLGFRDIPDPSSPRGKVYDPIFPERIYLRREVGD